MQTVKQKTRAFADFLGVMTILRKVVSLCCFSITLFSLQSAQRGPGYYVGPRCVARALRIRLSRKPAADGEPCGDAKRPQRLRCGLVLSVDHQRRIGPDL